MLKKTIKNLGELIWNLIAIAEVCFGLWCVVIYSLNPDDISNNMLGVLIGFIIMAPGTIWLFAQMIKYPEKKKGEETKDEELN